MNYKEIRDNLEFNLKERLNTYNDGLILQGCGGSIEEWVNGINELLTEENILLDDTKFSTVYVFDYDGCTNILYPFLNDVKLNIGKLAMWRLATHDLFGGTWLSDYIVNKFNIE